jgi:hypothetical protein
MVLPLSTGGLMTVHHLADQARRQLIRAIAAYMEQCTQQRAGELASARRRYEALTQKDLSAGAEEWKPLIRAATEQWLERAG